MTDSDRKLPLSYILPLRWDADEGRHALARYLREVATHCVEVLVIDGSPPNVFAANSRAWGSFVKHLPPDPDVASMAMGKVGGVLTGVRRAGGEALAIADDDVRYDRRALGRLLELLGVFDLVRPQNYFAPLPWHSRWDTSRTLLNRALGADYPGTLGVRKSTMIAMGGYDGSVLFENLELIRTVEAYGGRTIAEMDLYVRRIPPSILQFWEQRTRHAYEDFAIPVRMALWLSVLPMLAVAVVQRRRAYICASAIGTMLVAERGRHRSGGDRVFPLGSSLLAPGWVLERGVCAWLALARRVRHGGIRYRGTTIGIAANSRRAIRRRLEG